MPVPLLPAPSPAPEPETEAEATEADHGDRPWEESDFSPRAEVAANTDYYADKGRTYCVDNKNRLRLVAEFVPRPIGEVISIHDIDDPAQHERHVVLNLEFPNGRRQAVELEPSGGTRSIASSIAQAIPSEILRGSIRRPRDLGPAMAAFRPSTIPEKLSFKQTGWLPPELGGFFALPGAQDVDLAAIDGVGGARLLQIPEDAHLPSVLDGLSTLLGICSCAPLELSMLVLGTILAGPIFRRRDQLAARGFVTYVCGPTGVGKTTLVRRLYSLVGAFIEEPGCITTWSSTYAALEQVLHALRDLPVFIDDYRDIDPGAADALRRVVMAIGDGAGRTRTVAAGRSLRRSQQFAPRGLLIATGELTLADDGAVAGRTLEVAAQDIDLQGLLAISREQLAILPHVMSAWIAFAATLDEKQWAAARQARAELAQELASSLSAPTRAAENLATVATALDLFGRFVTSTGAPSARSWQLQLGAFRKQIFQIARQHAERVSGERIDNVVLEEIARGVRAGQVALVKGTGHPTGLGQVLGAYDDESIYLIPSLTTHWVSQELGRARRRYKPIGRKTLGQALAARGGGDGLRTQRMIAGRREGVWPVARAGLSEEWDGLLDPAATGDDLDKA